MIAATGIWIYIIYSTLTNGLLVRSLISKIFGVKNELPFSLTLLLGLSFNTAIAGYLSLFIETGLISNLILFLSGTVFLFIDKENKEILSNYFASIKQTHWVVWILGLGLFSLVLHQTTSVTLNADTPSYHALAIRFMEEYSVIPGLGNFYHRLAFNNSWFTTGALYGMSFLGIQSFNVLGHFMMIFSGFFILGGLNNLINGSRKISDWSRIILMPIFLYSWYFPHIGWTSTPSPDVPAALLIWIIFIYLFETVEENTKLDFRLKEISFIVIGFFLVTIKLSVAPIAIPLIYIAFKQIKTKPKNFIFSALLALFVLTPWLARNYYLSGYLIHPYPSIDLFSPEWKIPNEVAEKEKEVIQNWAKWPGWFKKPEGKKLEDLSYNEWYEVWYKNQTLPYLKLIFYSTFILWGFYLLSFIWGIIRNKNSIEGKIDELAIMISMMIGWIYWWLSAPDLRFGWGFMFVNLAVFLIYFLKKVFNVLIKNEIKHTNKLGLSLGIMFLIIITFNYYKHYELVSKRYAYFNEGISSENIYLPADYPISYGLKVETVNGIDIFHEANIHYPPLPGVNLINNPKKSELIGSTIQEGFKAKDE